MRRPALLFPFVFVIALGACSASADRRIIEGEFDARTAAKFYELPEGVPPGAPGAIIKSERLLGAPDGSTAWRVVYRTVDVTGATAAVSGVIVAPNGGDALSDRPVVSWGHPTTGAAARCAPSLSIDPFLLIEGVHELLDAGYVVAATDYPGLGVDGPSSYLIGASEGHSVLDAARAARAIPETGAGDRVLLWGHSQGGQAVLFAAQEAKAYAPELDVVTVAVAAPAAELAELLSDDIVNVSGVTIGSYALAAYSAAYDIPLSTILEPKAASEVPTMADLCLLGQNKQLHAIARPLVGHYFTENPATVEPWAFVLAENTPGHAPLNVPVLVNQGDADTLVHPPTTRSYVNRLCASGEHVVYKTYPDTNHGLVAWRSLPAVLPWFHDALEGRFARSTC